MTGHQSAIRATEGPAYKWGDSIDAALMHRFVLYSMKTPAEVRPLGPSFSRVLGLCPCWVSGEECCLMYFLTDGSRLPYQRFT